MDARGEVDRDADMKVSEIKAKLSDPALSANQRKKCRKKLSRLFNAVSIGNAFIPLSCSELHTHVVAASHRGHFQQEGTQLSSEHGTEHSSEFSGPLVGGVDEELSACYLPSRISSGRLGPQGLRANIASSPEKRRKRHLQEANFSDAVPSIADRACPAADAPNSFEEAVSAAASVGYSTAANSSPRQRHLGQNASLIRDEKVRPLILDASSIKAALPGLIERVPAERPGGGHSEGSWCLNTAAASETIDTAATGISFSRSAWIAEAVHLSIRPPVPPHIPSLGIPRLSSWPPPAVAATGTSSGVRPGRVSPRTGRGGDLSSVMHMIATELRTRETAAGAAAEGTAVGRMHPLLRGATAASGSGSKGGVGRGFCRLDLSQELSVISAGELIVLSYRPGLCRYVDVLLGTGNPQHTRVLPSQWFQLNGMCCLHTTCRTLHV